MSDTPGQAGPPPDPGRWQGSYGRPPEPTALGPYAPPPEPRRGPGDYPRQDLLPQEIKSGTNRRPIYAGVAAVLALIVVAGLVFFLLRDKGDDTRAEYCAELRDITHDGDLSAALSGADQTTLDRLLAIQDIAPTVVADDWKTLSDFAETAMARQIPDIGAGLEALNAFQVIADDAQNHCDLSLDIPGF